MRRTSLWRRSASAAAAVVLLTLLSRPAAPFPVDGDQAVLPAGSELNEDTLDLPREILRSESAGDRVSYVVGLGNIAFNSPSILGDVARRAGISCATCHVNGASNAKLFVPGLSTRPGTFDTTGALFNSKADNHVLDPVRIPSLRGARYLAPYGHDGRIASLREFVRNVIVSEFAGPEPSPAILDALVAYIQEIDFLPNPKLGPRGRLNDQTSEAERRGEALFSKPFPHDPNLSCAGCHVPSGAFVDHLQHDVGSGGLYRTPTLLNANFNAPYFHDGRYATFDEVVDHFDRAFGLGLSVEQRSDLLAYLNALGGAFQPQETDSVALRFEEIRMFSLVLAQAIAAKDREAIDLAVDTLGGEMRDLTDRFPDHRDTAITGALVERRMARAALKDVVISLRRIAMATAGGDLAAASAEYHTYYDRTFSWAMPLLRGTEPWSLFNPALREAHNAERRRMLRVPAQAQRYRASGGVMSKAALVCMIVALTLPASVGAAPLEAAAEGYRASLTDDIGQSLAGARAMRECLAADDLAGARRAWIVARVGWERSEVFTSGFVPELDRDIDAWPDANHGFHGIEATLFGASGTDPAKETDVLIAHLAKLHAQIGRIELAPQRLLNGVARLAFEVGGNKADGGESRLSGTSLNDMQSNADGIALAWRVIFADALEAHDQKLAAAVRAAIARLKEDVNVATLRNLDSEKLRADTEELVALLEMAAPAIGLSKPTLEEGAQ